MGEFYLLSVAFIAICILVFYIGFLLWADSKTIGDVLFPDEEPAGCFIAIVMLIAVPWVWPLLVAALIIGTLFWIVRKVIQKIKGKVCKKAGKDG